MDLIDKSAETTDSKQSSSDKLYFPYQRIHFCKKSLLPFDFAILDLDVSAWNQWTLVMASLLSLIENTPKTQLFKQRHLWSENSKLKLKLHWLYMNCLLNIVNTLLVPDTWYWVLIVHCTAHTLISLTCSLNFLMKVFLSLDPWSEISIECRSNMSAIAALTQLCTSLTITRCIVCR